MFSRALLFSILLSASLYSEQLPDGPGKDTLMRVCSKCHGAEIVIGRGNTEDGWTQVVLNMAARGAQATDEEFGDIVQYLTKNFPPQSAAPAKINVNKASATELKSGLDLSAKDADAIIAFRTKNGDFKSIEQLEKVPGIDASKIESKKDRVAF